MKPQRQRGGKVVFITNTKTEIKDRIFSINF